MHKKNGLVRYSWTFDEVNAEQSSDEYRENKFRHLCIIRMGHCVPSIDIFKSIITSSKCHYEHSF